MYPPAYVMLSPRKTTRRTPDNAEGSAPRAVTAQAATTETIADILKNRVMARPIRWTRMLGTAPPHCRTAGTGCKPARGSIGRPSIQTHPLAPVRGFRAQVDCLRFV